MKVMQTIYAFDVNLFMWVSERKAQRLLVRCARCISKSGDGHLYLLLGGILAWLGQTSDQEWSLLGCLLLAFALERPIYLVLKNLFRRDRPPVTLRTPSYVIPSDRFSLPSGHTSAAFLVATSLGHFYPALTPLLLCWATLIGMARVILGVHFPTDTLIGALMGTSLAITSMEMLFQ